MYVCECCGSTEHIALYFPALVKRMYDPTYGASSHVEGVTEESRDPERIDCDNCYTTSSDVDSWWVDNADRVFKCADCGNPEATEEFGYCETCEEQNN